MTSIGISAASETVRLSNDVWTVDIATQSLAVKAYPVESEIAVPISAAQPGFGDVAEFTQNDNTVSWRIADRFLTVRFELIGESLSVEFIQDKRTNEALNLTWPVIEDFESLRGYILPLFEGSYVPKNDIKWQDFLSERGPINTTAGLSMPFWGLDLTDRTLTYILTNPFNNQIRFNKTAAPSLGMEVSHTFTSNWEQRRYGLHISLGAASPIAPAKQYRHWLQQNAEFVSFAEKIEKTPAAEKLLGAAHVYLWGGKLLSQYDVTDWQTFATRLSGDSGVARQMWARLNAEAQKAIREIAQSAHPSKYVRRVVSRAISEQLEKPDFYNPNLWTEIPLTSETETLISRDAPTLSLTEVYRRNCLLFYAAFSDTLRHPDEWGDGLSVKLLEQFAENGLDRLWLGADSWQDGFRHPTAVAKAKELGYLVGPYDSYHSIHHPNEKDTWETAQFDLSLYESGAIVNADGTKSRGFKKKGYHLSPLVAQPYVENRVNGIVEQMPSDFNTWFIDCDAYGELYDDYSASHPATQLDDMRARLARISWIRDTHNMVVGSEGGAAYSAATLHFAHGMTLPVIGWGDPDMKSKTSSYYVGGYWPPEGPAIHIKQVPLKPNYLYHYYDPRFRLPLYQIVFHDSVITTHHWGSGSLKFKNAIGTLALLEQLYNVPPLYHLNMAEFSKHKAWIKRHYAFFSPLHRQIGGQAMTDFEWLTSDRQVQRTEFGDTVEIFANFRTDAFEYEGIKIPTRSVVARWIGTGKIEVFSVE
ncbi:MAG: hypothetical protein OXH00_03185 [Candidatus Poribacteria bacterium]|nr:hypothetical protein [Candidatus Poribacteria bacterium]